MYISTAPGRQMPMIAAMEPRAPHNFSPAEARFLLRSQRRNYACASDAIPRMVISATVKFASDQLEI
jgi:hypothetical protein